MTHADNLIAHLNIEIHLLIRVLIILAVDVSILYQATFIRMRLLLSMLNPPHSALKSLHNNLSTALGTIQLP